MERESDNMEKTFKSLNEQIEILKYKGMTINDEDFAKDVLLRENYFFISGYRHIFMSDRKEKYLEGTTFEEVYSLFLFDRTFRNIIFKNLLILENNLKSITSYQLSKKYGYKEIDYLKPKNFTTDPEKTRQVNDIIRKMKRQVRVNVNQHTATYHYMNNYGYIPLWIMVKVLSFGIVGELYQILKREDQEVIANIFGVDVEKLENYLPILANYRNLCAHEEIVFENKTQKEIEETIYHSILKIPKNELGYEKGINDIFALVIILRELLSQDEVNNLMLEIKHALDNLEMNLHTISINKVLDRMGFPENYIEIKNINKKVEE